MFRCVLVANSAAADGTHYNKGGDISVSKEIRRNLLMSIEGEIPFSGYAMINIGNIRNKNTTDVFLGFDACEALPCAAIITLHAGVCTLLCAYML